MTAHGRPLRAAATRPTRSPDRPRLVGLAVTPVCQVHDADDVVPGRICGGPLPCPEHPAPGPRPLLRSLGTVYVTRAAWQRYADAVEPRPGEEESRRELTEILVEARVTDLGPPIHARARSRRHGIDLSATAAVEGRLVVVLSCHVRATSRWPEVRR